MGNIDPFKVGVLLIGVAALIIAAIALHYYITAMKMVPKQKFYAYCSINNTVIVHAYEELKEVKVLKLTGEILCSFGRIPEGSDEVCIAPSEGVYLVQSGDTKIAVTCQSPRSLTESYED